MKTLLILIILITSQSGYSQFKIENLLGTWESFETRAQKEERNEDILLIESTESNDSNKNLTQTKLILQFSEKREIDFMQAGVQYKAKYELKDSILTLGNRKYIISKLTNRLLILKDFDNVSFAKETNYKKIKQKLKNIKEFEDLVEKFPSGKLKFKGMLHNGFNHGKHTEWYENGQKKSEKYFTDGISTGIWKEWNINGELIRTRKMN
ncbi:toxin-antitoxin system YwqK family antitoxin [Tenacibaculum sp. nBUS_03]|uniref:toxin-antitoxin system YwqK family antitoxin n=1 Tax=Tenacibaculum sp. nBUS_03 TaxID=3395320 RepID=UPI003EBBDDEA